MFTSSDPALYQIEDEKNYYGAVENYYEAESFIYEDQDDSG